MDKNQNELAKVCKIATDLNKQNLAELNQLALKLQNKFNTSLNTKLSRINAQMIQNTDLQLVYKKSQEALKICTTDIVNQISQVKIPKINYDLHAIFQKMVEQNSSIIKQTLKSIDFNDIENTLVQYMELLIEHQLPPLNEIEYSEIKRLIKIEDKIEVRKNLINNMIRIYDERRISSMLEEWKSFNITKKRIHIFEEIIWAHQNQKYNIAIPALIAQFEGLICDIVNVQGIWLDDVRKSHIKTILTTNNKYEIASVAKEFWINVLLDSKTNKDRFLSRHAILHGQDINYGYYEKSLILLIMMDSILKWFDKVSEDVIKHSKEEAKKIIQKKQQQEKARLILDAKDKDEILNIMNNDTFVEQDDFAKKFNV